MIAKLTSALLLLAAGLVAAEETTLSQGHSEIHLSYEPGEGLMLAIWDHDNQLFLDPDTTVIRVTPPGRVSAPGGLAWSKLGAGTGSTLWMIPQANPALENPPRKLVWFGTRSEIASGLFSTLPPRIAAPNGNQIGLRLLSVTGSGPESGGHFSLFTTDAFGDPSFRLATSDGVEEEDVIEPINTSSHTHYNWVFTRPGIYRLEMEAYGRLAETLEIVTERRTFTFEVEDAAAPLLGIKRVDSGLRLEWESSGFDTYRVESMALAGSGSWTEEAVLTPPAGPAHYLASMEGERVLYRLRIEPR